VIGNPRPLIAPPVAEMTGNSVEVAVSEWHFVLLA
jgi:hypothetical protein